MAMLRGLAAGATGAAAYNLYHDSSVTGAKDIAGGLVDLFQRKGAASMQELSRMHRQVDDLQAALLKTLHDRGSPTVILHGGSGGSAGKTAATGVAVVVGGAVLYLRFVRGWSFSDMMYVTHGALASMQESVNQSLSSVRVQVEAATADLVERLRGVGAQADEMLGKQEEMDGALREVGEEVHEVHAGVSALQSQVAYSNHAITLLCGALAEVAKRVGLSNGRYVRALDGLVHGAPGGGAQQRLPGDGGPAVAMLPAVDNLLLLEPVGLEGAAAPGTGGSPAPAAPRPNPAVFAVGGTNRAAAAVAAGAAPRGTPASAPGGGGGGAAAGGGSPYASGTGGGMWGRSISDIVTDTRRL